MKNSIMYYYNLNPENIHKKNDIYHFKIGKEKYFLYPIYRNNDEIHSIYKIDKELIDRKILIHEIILNNQNNILIPYNGIYYVLFKSHLKKSGNIELDDITFLTNNTLVNKTDDPLNKSNWVDLWSKKNDYLEYQISQFGIKHPIIVETFSYYIGLAENAIIYAKNTILEDKPNYLDVLTICHRRINDNTTLFDLFNPLEFVIDYKIRDVAEYIKFHFFFNKENLWEEIHEYFNHNILSIYSVRMFYARLLYPTYYFDLYDDILEEKINEEKIVNIIEKQEEYEEFLADIYFFISKKYNIPAIEWLIKK